MGAIKMKIYNNHLFLIDLQQKNLEGFRKFISCWVYHRENLTFAVDPGPASTIPLLVDALRGIGVSSLDYILLTHIHIDHAGGTGELLRHFPKAGVICHEKGIPHLLNPEKLQRGSLKVLGKIAVEFGPISKVPEENFLSGKNIITPEGEIKVIDTPGHAAHHQSFIFGDLFFAGEALGTYIPGLSDFYLRPATPPKFIYKIFSSTLKKLAAINPQNICFAHYGLLTGQNNTAGQLLRELERWIAYINKNMESAIERPEEITEYLIGKEPLLRGFHELPADIQSREKYFITNSVKGITRYLLEKNSR
jgi:glyoxylase-like metal-dependent hydrolase (beta-lactamase superfamily II)